MKHISFISLFLLVAILGNAQTRLYQLGLKNDSIKVRSSVLVDSNGIRYITQSVLDDTAAAIRADFPGGGGSPSLTAKYIGYGSGSNLLTGDSSFRYDDNLILLNGQSNWAGISITRTGGGGGSLYVPKTGGSLFNANDLVLSGTSNPISIVNGSGNIGIRAYAGNIVFNTNVTDRIEIKNDGSVWFTGVHTFADYSTNRMAYATPGGQLKADKPMPNANGYTPTTTNVTNVSSATVNRKVFYMRVGNIVYFTGFITATADASSVPLSLREFSITKPIASNFADVNDAIGSGTGNNGGLSNPYGIFIEADPSTDEIIIQFEATGGEVVDIKFTGSYIII